jgi:hypothetical protein
MVSSGLLRRVALVRTDVSEEPGASFIWVTKIGARGTTQAATSNRRNNPEDTILHSHRRENLKSYTEWLHNLWPIERYSAPQSQLVSYILRSTLRNCFQLSGSQFLHVRKGVGSQNHWILDFVHRLEFCIKANDVSGTGSLSVLRWREGDTYCAGSHRRSSRQSQWLLGRSNQRRAWSCPHGMGKAETSFTRNIDTSWLWFVGFTIRLLYPLRENNPSVLNIFWDVTPWGLVDMYVILWIWGQKVFLKRWYLSTKLHGSTCLKTVPFSASIWKLRTLPILCAFCVGGLLSYRSTEAPWDRIKKRNFL